MLSRWKSCFAWLLLIAMTTLPVVPTTACRNHRQLDDGDGGVESAAEPEQYSATVVRIIDYGRSRETSIAREARSAEKRRQDWTEQGQNRALIWRPDLGKGFLLDLDRQTYIELDITPGRQTESRSEDSTPHNGSSAPNHETTGPAEGAVQVLDRAFDEAPSPTHIETRTLPGETIEGHVCGVSEQRATFPDGHTEVTRTFRARDLAGFALRMEAESEQGGVRVITERRDVRLEVAPDVFIVPADFKKVDRLSRQSN